VVIEEITGKVVAGEEDPRLRWLPSGRVRVLIRRAFPDRAIRGPALHATLEARLEAAGWVWAPGSVLHTYRQRGTQGDRADGDSETRGRWEEVDAARGEKQASC
jgi:hypothetical protein